MRDSVSTIIPVYNGAKYIVEAIQSILNQSVKPQELIIVDDGSTDQTAELVRTLINETNTPVDIKLHSQKNAGVGAAMKAGVKLASGVFLTFIDSDDLWDSQKLEKQKTYLKAHPTLDCLFGMAKQFLSPELTFDQRAKLNCPDEAFKGLTSGAICLKRSRYYALGEFDSGRSLSSFIDWFSRASLEGVTYHFLDDIILYRRLHESNLSRQKRDDVHKEFSSILRARVAAKRDKMEIA